MADLRNLRTNKKNRPARGGFVPANLLMCKEHRLHCGRFFRGWPYRQNAVRARSRLWCTVLLQRRVAGV